MAKSKARPLGSKTRAPNPHLYARISFLYQSAQLLSCPPPSSSTYPTTNTTVNTPLSRFYLSTARTVAKKSVLRLSPSLKRTICKRCDAYLIPGTTSTHRIENNSHNGRKPWADVLVIKCNGCGAIKRFPVGMEAKRGPGWKLWSERPDVVVGGEEQEGTVHKETQQDPGNTTMVDIAKAKT